MFSPTHSKTHDLSSKHNLKVSHLIVKLFSFGFTLKKMKEDFGNWNRRAGSELCIFLGIYYSCCFTLTSHFSIISITSKIFSTERFWTFPVFELWRPQINHPKQRLAYFNSRKGSRHRREYRTRQNRQSNGREIYIKIKKIIDSNLELFPLIQSISTPILVICLF
jgi:hypothetical protein